MQRETALSDLFQNLNLLYNDLNRLILQYEKELEWETIASEIWSMTGYPRGLVHDQYHLYVDERDPNNVLTYNTKGEIIKKISSVKNPYGIEIDKKNSLLFVADQTHVTILDLNLDIVKWWDLPKDTYSFRGLKVDGNILYVTIDENHEIYLCNCKTGEVLQKFGKALASSKEGEFNNPRSMWLNEKYLYICDCYNHRAQILIKSNGIYFSKYGRGTRGRELGELDQPISIYCYSDIFYIGDSYSVQLFNSVNGECTGRIGDKEKRSKES